MAQQEAKPAETTEQPAPSRGKKLLIIGIAAVLVLALLAGGALWWKASQKPAEDADGEESAEVQKAEAKKKSEHPPVFVSMDPFTVNLVQETGDQYLQVALAVEFDEPTGEALMKGHMPKVRDAIIRLLGSKKASELASTDGKDKLALELRDAINEVLDPAPAPRKNKKGERVKVPVAEGPAKAVLFTAFIIQ
jgi:flagellar FliL protein